MDTLVI